MSSYPRWEAQPKRVAFVGPKAAPISARSAQDRKKFRCICSSAKPKELLHLVDRGVAKFHVKLEMLTPRELEVMALVTAGLMNTQSAGERHEITVKVHRGPSCAKCARVVAYLVRLYDSLGISREKPVGAKPKYVFSALTLRATLVVRPREIVWLREASGPLGLK